MKTYQEAEQAHNLLKQQYPAEIINLEDGNGKPIGYTVSDGQGHLFSTLQEVKDFLSPTSEYDGRRG